MPLKLNNVPGFSDVQNFVLEADDPALGIHVGGISNNASFGMVRLEFFIAKYHNGDTVVLPASPVDGYNYSRQELIYFWTIGNTGSPTNFWLTGPDCLWYLNHLVQQWSDAPQADNTNAGMVSCEEWYRKSSMSSPDGAKSNDGILLVFTVAQRQRKNLIIAHPPTFQGDMTPSIGVDFPWQQCLAQKLNVGAKFSVVNTEVMYMGEFINGDTVPTPVSPADGYAYSYSEVTFFPCWRWTTDGDTYAAPDLSWGQLQRMQMSVSSLGVCAVRIDMKGAGDTIFTSVVSLVTGKPFGRIAVFALCTRNMTIGAVGP